MVRCENINTIQGKKNYWGIIKIPMKMCYFWESSAQHLPTSE